MSIDVKSSPKGMPLQVVVAVDDTKQSKQAVDIMLDLLRDTAKVELLHAKCKRSNPDAVRKNFNHYIQEHQRISKLVILDRDPNHTVKETVCNYVNTREINVDLLVTGCHETSAQNSLPACLGGSPRTPRSLSKRLKSVLGSVSEQSLRGAHCSSLIVPRIDRLPSLESGWVLCVGVDGSQNSYHCYQVICSLLRSKQTLFVIHVETPSSNDESLPKPLRSRQVIIKYKQEIEQLKKQKPDCKVEFIEQFDPNVSDALICFARRMGAQIIACGADGMTAHLDHKRIMGSVSDSVVRKSEGVMTLVTQMNEFTSKDFST